MTLGKKLGSFQCEREEGFSFTGFVSSIQAVFRETVAMGQMLPEEAHRLQTPAWCNFCAACEQALDIGRDIVSCV